MCRYMKFVNHEENRWWYEENGVHYGCLRMAVNMNGELQEIVEKSLKTGVRQNGNGRRGEDEGERMKRESDNNKDQHQSHLDTLTSLQYALCEGCVL